MTCPGCDPPLAQCELGLAPAQYQFGSKIHYHSGYNQDIQWIHTERGTSIQIPHSVSLSHNHTGLRSYPYQDFVLASIHVHAQPSPSSNHNSYLLTKSVFMLEKVLTKTSTHTHAHTHTQTVLVCEYDSMLLFELWPLWFAGLRSNSWPHMPHWQQATQMTHNHTAGGARPGTGHHKMPLVIG